MPLVIDTPVSAPIVDELSKELKSLLTICTNGKSDAERKGAADELAQKINKVAGIQKGLVNYGILANLQNGVNDKKNANAKEGAFMAIASFATLMGQPALPHIISFLPMAFEGQGDKLKNVSRAAQAATKAILDAFNAIPHGMKAILPYLVDGLATEKCWQAKVAILNAFVAFAKSAAQHVDRALPEIIPAVSQCMWEAKPEVQKAAARALAAVCKTVTNPDLHPFIPELIHTIEVPAEVPETVYKLAATTFVTTVEAPSLAIMAPILGRGLNETNQAILRQTAVIIDNMCKLVEDPVHAQQFLPKLLPGLKRIIAVAADPELRNVASKAKNTLVRVGGGNENIVLEDYSVKTRRELDLAVASLKHIIGQINKEAVFDAATLDFVGMLCLALDEARNYNEAAWAKMSPLLETFVTPAQAAEIYSVINAHFVDLNNKRGLKVEEIDPEEGEELCNCEFSLAYGGMILLNNTRLRLTRGQRYGLCGPNGVGKSTLMRAIANGQLDGFPTADVLKTVFVEHNLQASDAEKGVLEFVLTDEAFKNKDQKSIIETLESVGFDAQKQVMPVAALSGGWKMKLELARAMLMDADILLLDEPTNHLDVSNVAWLTKYLQGLKDVTSIVVSHDSGFLDNICTHIVHYEYRKLKTYKGNLSKFVEIKPEARSYYSLVETPLSFKFPEPGFLEGIKSKDRAILKMLKAGYTYPGTPKPTISNVLIQCSLNSRVAVLGPNGAGKSTLIKVLTGEVEATSGDVWKHPNLRVAYVAQHAFHHVEQHLDKSPNEYIRWRFQNGEDRELAAKITRQLTPEEEKRMEVPIVIEGEKRKIETIMGRRNGKRGFEYEIKWIGKSWDENTWMARQKLEDHGIEKFLKIYDDKEAAREGLYQRPLTSVNVQKHLQDIGLEPEFSTHSRIKGLSGGQKVKVVLGACMWDNPHILVLDEPTNYLDRDSLGALAQAIKAFGGGVVMVSHHSEFTSAICTERWVLNDGLCKVEGTSSPSGVEQKLEMKEATEKVDAFGNVSKVKSTRTLSRKEQKAKERRKALKIKNGEPLSSDEEDD